MRFKARLDNSHLQHFQGNCLWSHRFQRAYGEWHYCVISTAITLPHQPGVLSTLEKICTKCVVHLSEVEQNKYSTRSTSIVA